MESRFEELNWKETALKGRTKKEIYRILTVNGKLYLPPEAQTNSEFVHDIMVGKKKASISILIYQVLKNKDVVIAHVPHIKGLRVHQLLYEARKHWDIDEYMPDLADDKLPSREYVINVSKYKQQYCIHSELSYSRPTSRNGW